MSAYASRRQGCSPVSTAKPNLAGKAARAWARVSSSLSRWASSGVTSPASHRGCTCTLRRASPPASSSTSCKARKPSSSRGCWAGCTPRNCRLARLVSSSWGWANRLTSSATPCACAMVKRPPGGRMRTTHPSCAGMGRTVPGHQPLTCAGVPRRGGTRSVMGQQALPHWV